jgi:Fe-coproporphyrin III synthase
MLSISRLLAGTATESDALRYGRQSGKLPSHLLHYSEDKKPVVVWTSTHRCNLHCAHCYSNSFDHAYDGELKTEEMLDIVDGLADFGCPVLLISGGEPMKREGVFDVAQRASDRGMRVVFSTNGTLITPELSERIAKIGASYVGISIDGRPATHNKFRGMQGAFESSLEALASCAAQGTKTGLRFTLTKANQQDLPWLFELMQERDIHRLCIYHLVPTGRGAKITGFAPTHEETRAAMDLIFQKTRELTGQGFEMEVLTADNHADSGYLYLDVLKNDPSRAEEVWNLLNWNGGNQSGRAIACIDSDGTVYPDQFWRSEPLGNLRERSFTDIWQDNPVPLLDELRDRTERLPDRCQGCAFLTTCNGNFRSRAEFETGDRWGFDPLCYLTDAEVTAEVPNAVPV